MASPQEAIRAAQPPYLLPPPFALTERQHEAIEEFNADPYEGIRNLMLRIAYATVPDYFLDVEHPDYERHLLSSSIAISVERTMIDLVNNCDTGAEYEKFIRRLRYRYAGITS